jgi:hypothetical protein
MGGVFIGLLADYRRCVNSFHMIKLFRCWAVGKEKLHYFGWQLNKSVLEAFTSWLECGFY